MALYTFQKQNPDITLHKIKSNFFNWSKHFWDYISQVKWWKVKHLIFETSTIGITRLGLDMITLYPSVTWVTRKCCSPMRAFGKCNRPFVWARHSAKYYYVQVNMKLKSQKLASFENTLTGRRRKKMAIWVLCDFEAIPCTAPWILPLIKQVQQWNEHTIKAICLSTKDIRNAAIHICLFHNFAWKGTFKSNQNQLASGV